MFSKVGFQMRTFSESGPSLTVSSNEQKNTHQTEQINSKSINSWPLLNGPLSIQKIASLNRSRSVSFACRDKSLIAGTHQTKNTSNDNRQRLVDNLINHLKVGSHDSLKIMKDVLQHHRYDTTLLDRYIEKRTPQNFKSLQMQIENQLFLTTNPRNSKN